MHFESMWKILGKIEKGGIIIQHCYYTKCKNQQVQRKKTQCPETGKQNI